MEGWRNRIASGTAGVLAALALSACGSSPTGTEIGAGFLVIAIDGLRADHVSCLGHDRSTTPTLDRLAEEGVVFRQAFSTAPRLLPAHVSLLTGCEPYMARRFMPEEFNAPIERRWRVPEQVPHLAVEFLANGFATAAFVDHPLLSRAFGFEKGFQLYMESDPEARDGVGAAALAPRLAQWLRSLDRRKGWFAYLHLNDLERSWTRPDPRWESYFTPRPEWSEVPPVSNADSTFFAIPRSRWRGGSRTVGQYEAMYDGHVRRVDEEIERLIGSIRGSGRYDQTTIVVVGTHGVQFGEAGLYLNSGCYTEADLHVPWIVRPAGRITPNPAIPPGTQIDGLASLADVAPTLLELAGIDAPSGTHGVSQAGFLTANGQGVTSPEDSVRPYIFASCGLQEGCAVIGPRYCLEYLLPGEVQNAFLRRSWYGEGAERGPGATMRFYDRLERPYPPLSERVRDGSPEGFERFREVGNKWIVNMQNTRRALQGTTLLFNRPLEDSVVAELKQLGYLGEGY